MEVPYKNTMSYFKVNQNSFISKLPESICWYDQSLLANASNPPSANVLVVESQIFLYLCSAIEQA